MQRAGRRQDNWNVLDGTEIVKNVTWAEIKESFLQCMEGWKRIRNRHAEEGILTQPDQKNDDKKALAHGRRETKGTCT